MNPQRMTIFDSRKSTKIYGGVKHTHHRTADFYIPPGMMAVVELTTHHKYLDEVTFVAVRRPRALSEQSCFDATCEGKRYHQVPCSDELGAKGKGTVGSTQSTERAKTTWRLGNDYVNNVTHDFRFITRPGDYYLTADKGTNNVLTDCENPTIIEVTLVPVTHNVQVQNLCH